MADDGATGSHQPGQSHGVPHVEADEQPAEAPLSSVDGVEIVTPACEPVAPVCVTSQQNTFAARFKQPPPANLRPRVGTSVADERTFSIMNFVTEQRPRLTTHLEATVRAAEQNVFGMSTFPLSEAREEWQRTVHE